MLLHSIPIEFQISWLWTWLIFNWFVCLKFMHNCIYKYVAASKFPLIYFTITRFKYQCHSNLVALLHDSFASITESRKKNQPKQREILNLQNYASSVCANAFSLTSYNNVVPKCVRSCTGIHFIPDLFRGEGKRRQQQRRRLRPR